MKETDRDISGGTAVPLRPVAIHHVTITGNGAGFACLGDESVLAAMRRQGVGGVDIGCRGGGCGVCRVRVRSGSYRLGKMARIHVSEHEQSQGVALACRLYPLGDLELVADPPPSADSDRTGQ